MSGKTEEPTPRRLAKAREQGESGASAHAAQAVAFLIAVALAPHAMVCVAERAAADLRGAIARAAHAAPSVVFGPWPLAKAIVVLTAPLLLACAAGGALGHLAQTGGVFAGKRLAPRLDRLDVAAGFKSLFSIPRAYAVVRAAAGGAIVAWLSWRTLAEHAADLAHVGGRLGPAGSLAGQLAVELARLTAVAGLVLGAADLVVTRRSWRRRLRMTKDEVRREHKESEGDPQIKAARQRAHREMLAASAVANVKQASVVIVNPTHLACALRYDETADDSAPVVVSSGEGELAARIIAAARDFGVPVVRDVPLARALAELEIGDAIPEALYEAVAEILREVWDEAGD